MDVVVKKKVDELKTLVGVANPISGGTDTVMGMNKLLLNQLGNDDPATGDRSSVMGYNKLLEDLLGGTGDAASSTGTIMSRLKYIITTSFSTISTSISAISTAISTLSARLIGTKANIKIGSASGASATYATAHSFTGAGTLQMVAQSLVMDTPGTGAYDGSVRITLDGTVLYDGVASKLITLGGTGYYISNTSLPIFATPVQFTTSLLIEHKSGDSDTTVFTTWNYTT